MSFEYFIKNNFNILNILFHINENNITIVNNNTRIIKKDIYISNIFNSLPILKTLLEDILKEFILIETKIKESYNTIIFVYFHTYSFREVRGCMVQCMSQPKCCLFAFSCVNQRNVNEHYFEIDK